MEFEQLVTAVAGWAVVSVPVSLLIGAFIGLGAPRVQEMPLRVRTSDRR